MTLPLEFWDEDEAGLLALLFPAIEEYVMAGLRYGARQLAVAGITVDYSLAHADAARWSRQHTDALLSRLNSTTQGSVGEIVANWMDTPGATRGDLVERLTPILGENVARAENVGITEVTRAAAQGNYLAYQQAGIELPPFFDSGIGIRQHFGPPGHPRCRCWPRVVYLFKGTWVIVWSTNRDELVCRTPIQTPWGEVQGCRSLHNVVLSAGPYMGMSVSAARAAHSAQGGIGG